MELSPWTVQLVLRGLSCRTVELSPWTVQLVLLCLPCRTVELSPWTVQLVFAFPALLQTEFLVQFMKQSEFRCKHTISLTIHKQSYNNIHWKTENYLGYFHKAKTHSRALKR